MTNCWRRVAAVVMTAAVIAACASDPPSPPPTQPPTAADTALVAYRAFWTVVDSALAAPRAKAWEAELQGVATGQALDTALADVRNFASLPAHTEGSVQRTPVVADASNARVSILDCVDLGESRLVSDATGQTLDDLQNRATRYRFRAELSITPTGSWLVDRTAPALAESC